MRRATFFGVMISVLTFLVWTNAAQAYEQYFPTGDAGYSVTFAVADIPGSRSACVISLARGLPTMGVAINIYGDGGVIVNALWTRKIPEVTIGSSATIRINAIFLIGKTVDSPKVPENPYSVLSIRLEETHPSQDVGDALTDIVLKGAYIEIIADGRHFPAVEIPPAERLNAAMLACLQYQAKH